MTRIALLSLGILLATGLAVRGQGLTLPSGNNSRPITGSVGGTRAPAPMLSGPQNDTVKVHHGPTGKPCVTVSGNWKAQTINPNIFEHLIIATNACSLRIKMNVCYYKTQHCIALELGPYDRKEAVLGIYPALKDFRYEYKEQF
jgi:hypothetical protein